MRAGTLRHLLTIHSPVIGQSTLTGEALATSWTTSEVWGNVETLKGYESFVSRQVDARVDTKIVTRFTTVINAKSLIVVNGATYNVMGVVNSGERSTRLELTCYKVVE
jgi:SPP1 family predicted phage head-tail adaptor